MMSGMKTWEREFIVRLGANPLGLGDPNSPRVDLWRARLRSKGFVLAGFGRPFDKPLQSATIVAQLAVGVEPDGVVGPVTWKAVGKLRKKRRPIVATRALVPGIRPKVIDCRNGRNGFPVHAWKRWDQRPAGSLRYKLGHYTGNDVPFINDASFHVRSDYLAPGGAPSLAYGAGVDRSGAVLVFNDPDVVTWHCFPPGTVVGGYKPFLIGSEQPDHLIGHDGSPHRVVRHFEREYDGDLVELRVAGTLPIRVTPEHPILIVRPYRTRSGKHIQLGVRPYFPALAKFRPSPEWVKAGEIVRGDYVLSPTILPSPISQEIAESDDPNTRPIDLSAKPETAWLIGLYVGDGYDHSGGGIGFVLSDAGTEARAISALRSLGSQPRVIKRTDTYVRIAAHSVILSRSFRAWCGASAPTKQIPEFIFNGEWDLSLVLDGLIAADGHTSRDGARIFDSTSLTLAYQTWHIAVTLGLRPTVTGPHTSEGGYANGKPTYRVRIAREGARWSRGQRVGEYYAMPILSVSRTAYTGPVFNFEVTDTNSYLANGVAAHNCDGGFNSYTYGIAFQGGTSGPNAAQRKTLRWLYRELERGFSPRKGEKWKPLPARDTVHRKVNSTSCPGDIGEAFYRRISLAFADRPTKG